MKRHTTWMCLAAAVCVVNIAIGAQSKPAAGDGANLAVVATPTTSYVSGHETLTALNDGATPRNSGDKSHGAYGNWPEKGKQWVQYEWSLPISTAKMDVYWFDDHGGVRLPKACRLTYWNGKELVPVPAAQGLGVDENKFNTTTYPEITTTKIRLEFDSNGDASTGLLDWRIYDSGKSPNFPPVASAGVDRVVVLGGKTFLSGKAKDDGKPGGALKISWQKASGPGKVRFDDQGQAETQAQFSAPGEYVLKLVAYDGKERAGSELHVSVVPAPPKAHLEPVLTTGYKISSPFWRNRLRNQVLNWIPHCVQKIEDPETKEGGIENFVQAKRKLAGDKDAKHTGAVFANTWVYNTAESICMALMLDSAGDPELAAAQQKLRNTLEDWIPKFLGAQEPDGYLHTHHTINGNTRWSNKHDHEDYQAGYFIEAAIAHHQLTGGKDTRMLDGARRLADCWARNIGPNARNDWYPGHQELEQALVRFARLIEQVDGPGKGAKYVQLAKFLLDARKGGDEYDQSHAVVTRQYEAVGHAVRAMYSYAGMADVAMETGDVEYQSAIRSLWHSIVNRKYYITGGVGSGETSEGFGKEYSLPNHAYCESCANSGELFFQHKMHMIDHDARYADLFEDTLYNAILGDVDLDGQNYTYTNPLDSNGKRYKWHVCPCCVGNIPRTLLSLPTWMYTKGERELYVNLYAGSTVSLGSVGGKPLQVVQQTEYPWKGNVKLTLNPSKDASFSLKLRVPNRDVSQLYTTSPSVKGLIALKVNGKPVRYRTEQGYAVIERTWKAGDSVELELPMAPQRIKASPKIPANLGRVALRYGPLIYNFESVDQKLETSLKQDAPLQVEFKPDLLDGVMVIRTTAADGSPLMAIPNYARLNRGGRSTVWMKDTDAELSKK